MTKTFQIFADYHQFYIQDDDRSFGDLSKAWTKEASERMLALAPHVVGVGTWRNSKVSVSINISEKRPDVSGIAFDVINECTIQIDTGRLVLAGCTDYFPDAERFQLVPGPYNVLIGYKGLRTISKNGLDGDDSYHLYLWSGAPT